MKITLKSSNEQDIKRFLYSKNMALFIWELVHNGFREFKDTDYDWRPAWKKIHQLLEEHNIDIDDLID